MTPGQYRNNGRWLRRSGLWGVVLVMMAAALLPLAGNVRPAQAALASAVLVSGDCARATVRVDYSGLTGYGGTNYIRVQAYNAALGLPAGGLGQVFSGPLTAAAGSLTLTVNLASNPGSGTVIALLVSQLEGSTFASISDVSLSYTCVSAVPTSAPASAMLVQRVIYCETRVYDSPGGVPVGDNMIHYGQVWYVRSVPELDRTGRRWTAIDTTGPFLGYIPTDCIDGGASAPVVTPTPWYYPPSYPAYPGLPGVPGLPSGRYYIVQPGDNLFRISLRFGTTIATLAALNGIVDVSRIYVGQRLILP